MSSIASWKLFVPLKTRDCNRYFPRRVIRGDSPPPLFCTLPNLKQSGYVTHFNCSWESEKFSFCRIRAYTITRDARRRKGWSFTVNQPVNDSDQTTFTSMYSVSSMFGLQVQCPLDSRYIFSSSHIPFPPYKRRAARALLALFPSPVAEIMVFNIGCSFVSLIGTPATPSGTRIWEEGKEAGRSAHRQPETCQ